MPCTQRLMHLLVHTWLKSFKLEKSLQQWISRSRAQDLMELLWMLGKKIAITDASCVRYSLVHCLLIYRFGPTMYLRIVRVILSLLIVDLTTEEHIRMIGNKMNNSGRSLYYIIWTPTHPAVHKITLFCNWRIAPTISPGSYQNIGLHTGARANVVLLT